MSSFAQAGQDWLLNTQDLSMGCVRGDNLFHSNEILYWDKEKMLSYA